MRKIFTSQKKSLAPLAESDKQVSDSNYYVAAKNWYQEVYESIGVSRQRYRLLSLSLGVLLALSITAIVVMMPLKKSVYRLIEVNQQTGEVTDLKEVDSQKYSENWAIIHYFLSQYVVNRHSYSMDDIMRTFNIALAMSNKEIADNYTQAILDTNPASPLNTLNKNYYREVMMKGINQLNPNTALVRFDTVTQHRIIKSDRKKESFQAIVKWTFQNPAESLNDRDKNPLGFTVNYYQLTPINTQNNEG